MNIVNYVKDRVAERTSWDGGVVIAISVLALIASPVIKWVAWAGLAYGIWAIIKKD